MRKLTTVIGAAAMLGSSALAMAADTKLGVLMDITGPIASFIPPLQNAANLAVKHVNEQGGLLDGKAIAVSATPNNSTVRLTQPASWSTSRTCPSSWVR